MARLMSVITVLSTLTMPMIGHAETATFKYDAFGRLVRSFREGGPASGTLATTSFDPADNRSIYAVTNTTRTLRVNDRFYSADNRFYLILQPTGTLAVMTAAGTALWSSSTTGSNVDRAAFQANGNLSVFNTSSAPIWQSSTSGNPAATLVMQNDGNLRIVSDAGTTLWQSNTGGH